MVLIDLNRQWQELAADASLISFQNRGNIDLEIIAATSLPTDDAVGFTYRPYEKEFNKEVQYIATDDLASASVYARCKHDATTKIVVISTDGTLNALTFGNGGESALSFDFQNSLFFANNTPQDSIYDIAPNLERVGNATTVDENGNVVYVPQNRFAYTDFSLISSDAWVNNQSATSNVTVDGGDVILEQDGTSTTTGGVYWQGSGAATIDVQANEKHRIIFDISQETGNHDWVYVLFWDGSSQNGQRIWIDLENQVEGTQNSAGSNITLDSYAVEFLGNGAARVTITASRTAAGNIFPLVGIVDGDTKIATTTGQTCAGSIRISNPACFRWPMQPVPEALRTTGASAYFLDNTDAGERYLARTEHHLYNGSGWTNKRLALSSAVTNAPRGSYSTPTAASAVVTNLVVTDDAGYGFEGAGSCARFAGSGASATQRIWVGGFDATNPSGLGVWVPKTSTQDYIQFINSVSVNAYVNFSLLDGSVGDIGTDWTNARIEANDRGLFWQFYVEDPGGIGGGTGYLYLVDSNTAGWAASSATSDYIDIAHMDAITSGSAVAPLPVRCFGASTSYVADNDLSFANALIPSYTDRFGVAAKFEYTYADENANPQMRVFRWTDGTNAMEFDMQTGGTATGRFVGIYTNPTDGTGSIGTDSYTPGVEVRMQGAALWTDDDLFIAKDGTSYTQSLPTQIPTPTGDVDSCMGIASGSGIIYVEQFQINTSSNLTVTDTETVTT